MFLVRDIEPRPDQPQMFVIELPYPITDLSKLPDAAAYRRLDTFQEQWVEPACEALGWTFVASKSEDGSFFLYLYGSGDPNVLLEKLAPFDGTLAFFSEVDADWSEYAALRELVEQAEAAGEHHAHPHPQPHADDEGANHEHTHGTVVVSEQISVLDLTEAPSPPRNFDRAPTVDLRRPATAARATAGSSRGARKAKPKAASRAPARKTARAKATTRSAGAAARPRAKNPAATKTARKAPGKQPATKRPATKRPATKRPKSRTTRR